MARILFSSVLAVALLLVCFATPTSAFGAGYVSPGSHLKTTRFRHGDIALAIPLLATANRRIVKQIYFGSWLRDFSQLLDKGSITLVPRPILRALVAVFAFLQFGYSTREFEVTDERLGVYRPEEHVDNPGLPPIEPQRSVAGTDEGSRHPIVEDLRPVVHPEELLIDPETGMKKYIGNILEVGKSDLTAMDYVQKQLVAAITCGRQGDEEAKVHLGAAMHALEDFLAHSNYVELALQRIGHGTDDQSTPDMTEALKHCFAFVGSDAKVNTALGPAAPIVTGTFGALDLYQTILGEVEDKLNAVGLPSLENRLPSSEEGGKSEMAAQHLIALLSGLTPSFDKDILKIQKTITNRSSKSATWGEFDEQPEKLWEAIEPVLRLRDDIVKWVYDHLAVRAVQDALATISAAIDKLVFFVLGTVLRPILSDLSRALKSNEQKLLQEDQAARLAKGEQTIFDPGSSATDPTHSQLAKDHYSHPLNEVAGRVAVRISSYTVNEIVQLWQPGNTTDPRSSIQKILQAFHHPFNYSSTESSPIQALMLEEVQSWVRESLQADPQGFQETLKSLSLEAVASRIDAHAGGHTHVDVPSPNIPPDQLLSMRLNHNIEQQVRQGSVKDVSADDLPGIKEILFASPSADSPSPVDACLTTLPGISFLAAFDGIDTSEIAMYPGMGETLKDALSSLILLDEKRGAHEEEVASAKSMETKARLKELRPLLDFKGGAQPGLGKQDLDESKAAAAKSKLSAGMEKLKLKAGRSS